MITEIKGDLPAVPQGSAQVSRFRAVVTGVDGTISEQGDGLPGYEVANASNRNTSQVHEIPEPVQSQTLSDDKDWVETLRELQTNFEKLKQAKGTPFSSTSNSMLRKAVDFSIFSRGKRSQKTKPGNRDGKGPEDANLAFIGEELEDQERVQNIRVHEQLVLEGMCRLVRTHPDPSTRAEWATRVDKFSRTLEEAKKSGKDPSQEDSILGDIGKGLALMVMAPVFAVGAMTYGLGKLVVGIGHAMTFGKMK